MRIRVLSTLARRCPLLCAAGLLACSAPTLTAQTADTWNGGTGNWSDSTFWSAGVPNSVSASVFVDGGKAVNSTVTVDGSYTVGALNISAGDAVNVNNGQTFVITDSGGSSRGRHVHEQRRVHVGQLLGRRHAAFRRHDHADRYGHPHAGQQRRGGQQRRQRHADHRQRPDGARGDRHRQRGGLRQQPAWHRQPGHDQRQRVRPDPFAPAQLQRAHQQRHCWSASNGGTLQLTGNFTNNATITALDGSSVRFASGTNLTGGTLSTAGTGTISNVTTATLTNVTNNGTFIATDAATTNLAGTITNNGTITLGNSSGGVTTVIQGNVTLAGTGNVTLVNNDVVTSSGGTGKLTIGQSQTIQGATGTGSGVGFGSSQLGIVNQGTINANVSGQTLLLQPSSSGLTNNVGGALKASNGGTLALSNASGGTFTNSSTADNGSSGVFQVFDSSTLTVSAGGLTNFSGTTLTGGSYYVASASTANPATLSFGGGSIVTNNASIELNGPGAVFNEINALANNASNGYFEVVGGRPFTTVGALTNAGSLCRSRTPRRSRSPAP